MKKSNELILILAFSGIAAILSLLIGGYAFGIGDHIEQLPSVLRAADNTYLSADFFTNASSTIGPRFFVSQFIGVLSRYIQIETIYFILTLITKFFIAWVTISFVREISNGSILSGMLTVSFIFVVAGFNLGDASELRFIYLTPRFLVLPLIMLVILMALRGKILIAMGLSGFASLIHPTLGLETGALVLGTYFMMRLLNSRRSPGLKKPYRFWDLAGGILIFSVFVALWWVILRANTRIPSGTFIEILAQLRHPHHYLPSEFPLADYGFTILFILTLGVSLYFWTRKQMIGSEKVEFITILFGLIGISCIAGFIFVEVFPSRLFTSAQMFRLLLILKWVGIGIVAANTGLSIERKHKSLSEYDGYLILIGVISPILMFLQHLTILIRFSWSRKTSTSVDLPNITGPLFLYSILIGCLFISTGFTGLDTRSIALYLLLVLASFSMVIWKSGSLNGVIISSAVTLGFVSILFISPMIMPAYYDNYISGLRPELRMESRYTGELAILGDFIRNHSPEDSTLITPPNLGEIRLIADRSIVVDFKAFPFSDQGMLAWRDRIFDIYGETNSGGFLAARDLDNQYRQISDTELRETAEKYGACYAILYSNTDTHFQVFFSTSSYKLVEIPNCIVDQ